MAMDKKRRKTKRKKNKNKRRRKQRILQKTKVRLNNKIMFRSLQKRKPMN